MSETTESVGGSPVPAEAVAVDDRAAAEVAAPGAKWLRPGIYRRHHYLTVALFVVATGVLAPMFAESRSSQYLVNLWLVYSIAAVGFYWVFGLAGRFAFCQTFMMALGGYMGAWTARSSVGGGFLVQLVLAMVSRAVAVVVGLLVRKAQAFYFAIATIAVAEMGRVFFSKAEWFTGLNGTTIGIPPIRVFGREYIAESEVFWVFLGVLTLVLLAAAMIERSPLRRDAVAARDNGCGRRGRCSHDPGADRPLRARFGDGRPGRSLDGTLDRNHERHELRHRVGDRDIPHAAPGGDRFDVGSGRGGGLLRGGARPPVPAR